MARDEPDTDDSGGSVGADLVESWRRLRDRDSLLARATLYGVPTILVVAVIGFSRVDIVTVLVFGLQTGAIYSLVALGIALVYKATRVLNFAQGEFGTVPAFIAYTFLVGTAGFGDITIEPNISRLWWASIIAVLAGAVIAVLVNVLVVQRLADASEAVALVATGGLALMFSSAEILVYQAQVRPFPRYVEGAACLGGANPEGAALGLCPLTIGGQTISWHTLVVFGVLLVTSAVLGLFFRSRTGIALLATAQEPFAAQLQGVSVKAMATLAWGTAGALGAVAGLLTAANVQQIRPGLLTTDILIPAFTGALLGGLTSMVGAVVGGLLIGITVTFANSAVLSYGLTDVLPGPPFIATFIVLLAVLLFRPRGLFGRELT